MDASLIRNSVNSNEVVWSGEMAGFNDYTPRNTALKNDSYGKVWTAPNLQAMVLNAAAEPVVSAQL